MSDGYETGALYGFTTPTLPSWQRAWYEARLLETVRTKSILVPYTTMIADPAAVNAKTITYTEVMDLEPNWNAMSEATLWKKGQYLDSRTVSIGLEWYWDIIKYTDHLDTFTYLRNGDASGIVREKLGQSVVDTQDILARNAFLSHPAPSYADTATSRATLTSSMLFDPDVAESVRVQLQEAEVPGLATTDPGMSGDIVCVTSPRVIYDIRNGVGSAWTDVQNYNGTGRKFNSEVGMWNGTRFVMTNRMRLRNAGLAVTQTQLAVASVEGQGAAATVDSVYTPGQSNSTRYIEVDDASGFSAGQYITIHAQSLGTTVLDSDGSQETRRIVSINTGATPDRIALDRPLLKAHAENDYVTNALDVHASIFLGGPGVVYAVAEAPNVIVPPKYDDAMLINRLGWRGMFKFQLFRPEFYAVHYSAGSSS